MGLELNGRADRVDDLNEGHSLDNLGDEIILSARF
jgi:hypothetical protein